MCHLTLASVAHWLGHWPDHRSVASSIPSWERVPGFQVRSCCVQEAAGRTNRLALERCGQWPVEKCFCVFRDSCLISSPISLSPGSEDFVSSESGIPTTTREQSERKEEAGGEAEKRRPRRFAQVGARLRGLTRPAQGQLAACSVFALKIYPKTQGMSLVVRRSTQGFTGLL